MTRGVSLPTIPSLFEMARDAHQQAQGNHDSVASACPHAIGRHEGKIRASSAGIGLMSGLVGNLCVKLHQWCFEVWGPRTTESRWSDRLLRGETLQRRMALWPPNLSEPSGRR